MEEINWALIAPLLVIQAILMIVALVDLVKARDTNGPKWLWLIIILFVTTIGPIIYFIFGRRNR
ncbi:PLD nuclease N-terminal domain-containing protein [Ornithinibacillus halophilus]|uniref:Phospholipase_D-nuclease N-terminal n=1 Tax=Ornithinibacillus halophilus TaxID=930117 RepID=A0A1M5MN97_9BACI|nr:PLD nuclease N-terminal domain-containing protein [Ornithinibacillus halophilus]SHG78904.1 Phospholipase_D-nuclease N-terminal [Ornithinibacillus halophilus]